MRQKRVVITGMGAVTPLGNNVQIFWQNLLKGKSGAGPISRFDASPFSSRFACEVKGFDPAEHMESKWVRRTDLYTQFALAATDEAMQQAGLKKISVQQPERAAVIWASTNGGMSTLEKQLEAFHRENNEKVFSPYHIPKTLPDTAAGLISIRYGLKGANFCPVAACASTTTAIAQACQMIRWGKADMVVTGGSEAPITPGKVGGLGAVNALSRRNDNPEAACRPFDVDRDGFVIGEGAGALVIESLEHAQERGATILAEIAGTGLTADAWHMTASHPEGEGAASSMRLALQEAEIAEDQVDHLNAHATSTKIGDLAEVKAIQKVFHKNLRQVSISATKSMTGHLLGASGALSAIIAVNSTLFDCIPPIINTETIDPALPQELNLSLGKVKEKKVVYALSNAFGFGGHNASLVIRKA